MMSRQHCYPALYLLFLTTFVDVVFSQASEQPLGDVLHLLLDKDKNQKVDMREVNSHVSMLWIYFQNSKDEKGREYRQLMKGVRDAAPTLFQLIDSNGDKGLTKSELLYVTKFEKSLKKGGGMRDLLRVVFNILDTDGDDRLSADELYTACQSSGTIAKVSVLFHDLFPIRKTPKELEDFIRDTIESIRGGSATDLLHLVDKEQAVDIVKWIDDDGDGFIQRKEVGKYYNIAGRKFLEISKAIKQMGPMLAMLGGIDVNSGGAGVHLDGFQMEL